MRKLETEADVINVIGYETKLYFKVLTEGIVTYETNNSEDEVNYSVDLFLLSDVSRNTILEWDSFDGHLLDYQIFEVINLDTNETIYHNKWVDDFNSNETNLGLFLNNIAVKDRFEKNVKSFGDIPLRELYKMEDWVLALGKSFPFDKTGKEEESWKKVMDLAIERQIKQLS